MATRGTADGVSRSPELARVIAFFETIDEASVERLDDLYAEGAHFKDPFNDVRGTQAIRHVFERMFEQVGSPRFHVIGAMQVGTGAFLIWEFRFRFKRFDTRSVQTIRGASHLDFAADGRVARHRDYWDAAEELYEKLPLVGTLMRWLKRRAA